jgi:hypothetical protein
MLFFLGNLRLPDSQRVSSHKAAEKIGIGLVAAVGVVTAAGNSGSTYDY